MEALYLLVSNNLLGAPRKRRCLTELHVEFGGSFGKFS